MLQTFIALAYETPLLRVLEKKLYIPNLLAKRGSILKCASNQLNDPNLDTLWLFNNLPYWTGAVNDTKDDLLWLKEMISHTKLLHN